MSNDQPFQLELSDVAEKVFRKLDPPIARRIGQKLLWLAENADTFPHNALIGQWRGYFRYRVGDYRAIYRIEEAARVSVVEFVGHRREIYDE